MKALLLVVVFVVAVYIYTSIRNKKNRIHTQNIDTVNEFRKRYLEKRTRKTDEEKEYIQYTTKYNISIDFIDKDEFIQEVQVTKSKLSERPSKHQKFT